MASHHFIFTVFALLLTKLCAASDYVPHQTCHSPNGAVLLPSSTNPRDCADVRVADASAPSDIYTIYPEGTSNSGFKVFCDMRTDGGGWTVFQRRNCGCIDFYRNWTSYADGFGCLPGEHWLGNDKLSRLTSDSTRPMSLRVDLTDWSRPAQTRYATYSTFSIGSATSLYKMTIAGYSGDAGDSMIRHNNMKFSTLDRDNDIYSGNCAVSHKGAWWYKDCHDSNLNGVYVDGGTTEHRQGLNWRHWLGHSYSLKVTEMKVRPNNYRNVCAW